MQSAHVSDQNQSFLPYIRRYIGSKSAVHRIKVIHDCCSIHALFVASSWAILAISSSNSRHGRSHKGAACFRDKPFPQFDNLCKIFGKDRATGHGATDLGEDVIEETQRNSPINVEGLEDIVEETQQTARINSKRKRPPTNDTESSNKEAAKKIKETFKEVGEKLNETIYNIGRQENKEACDIIDKVIEDIQRMPNIYVKQRNNAIDIFSKDQFHARAFFKITEEENICYMEMIADGSIS
ncbi:unnamed protein product [Lactuca virosa]|uniref:Uncharacterized protein n=1 Tax=Lactuca virosa TaxID=75947 RepID=A0AAU9MWD4_9ASTR|nr:unnamed protein product [Lactuca virosa]